MTENKDRRWELEVFVEGTGSSKIIPTPGTAAVKTPQILFEITQGISRGMDLATITLVNMNPSTRGYLKQDNLKIILRAGYEQSMGLIFAGQVARRGVRTSTVYTKDDTDGVLVIEAGSGEIALQETRFDKSYQRGVTNLQILRDIAASLGVILRDESVIPLQTYSTGWASSGKASAALDALANDIQSTWTLQNDTLLMMPPDIFSPQSAALISSETGLVGRVVETVNGVEFKTLLDPRLRPGRSCVVNALGIKNGKYRLDKVKHSGDFRGDTWHTDCFSRYLG